MTREYRGQGIGPALLGQLLDAAESQEIRALSLSVEKDNPALRLYERFGFTPLAEADNAVTMLRRFK